MELEYYAEMTKSGKMFYITIYQHRYDAEFHMYWSRVDGIQSKQKKRVLDWVSRKPENIKTAVKNFIDAN